MSEYTKSAIEFAFDNKLSDMQDSIQNAIASKITDALEAKKVEVAQGMFGVTESWDSDDEDDDVARADRELARMKAKPIKAAKGVDAEKDMAKLAKKTKEKEEVDEALSGKQHKLDKNKNGKLDSHDFKLLRKESEETSHYRVNFDHGSMKRYGLDRKYDSLAHIELPGKNHSKKEIEKHLSKEFENPYVHRVMLIDPNNINRMHKESEELEEKLDPSMGVKAYIDDFIKSDNPKFEGKSKKERIQMALGAYYAAKKGTNEEVEELDELSKKTLGSYVNKAAKDIGNKSYDAGHTHGSRNEFISNRFRSPEDLEADAMVDKSIKRQKGIEKAVDKITGLKLSNQKKTAKKR